MADFNSLRQIEYVGLLDDVSSADSVENEVMSILAKPFRVVAVHYQVTTGVTTASATTTLYWRPTPGSATDAVHIATWEQPVQAAEGIGVIPMKSSGSTTTVGAASATGGYGIGGTFSYAGELDTVVGKGGSLIIAAGSGEPDAGAVNFWVEVDVLSDANANALKTSNVEVIPDVVGS